MVCGDRSWNGSRDHPGLGESTVWSESELGLAVALAGIDFWCLYDTERITVCVQTVSWLLAGLGTPDTVWSIMCSLQESNRLNLRANAGVWTTEEEAVL